MNAERDVMSKTDATTSSLISPCEPAFRAPATISSGVLTVDARGNGFKLLKKAVIFAPVFAIKSIIFQGAWPSAVLTGAALTLLDEDELELLDELKLLGALMLLAAIELLGA